MHRIPLLIQDNENENENEFTNKDLIALFHQRNEWDGSSEIGSSGSSSNSLRVVFDDENLYIKQVFPTKKDLLEVMHQIALKCKFMFKVKKLNKSFLTIICVDDSWSWSLQATKKGHQ